MTRYRLVLLWFATISSQYGEAFTSHKVDDSSLERFVVSKISLSASDEGTDVSIPYDAAARLAYEKWLKDYDKGDFDATRYKNFKKNYEFITINNIKAKRIARESGAGEPKLWTLNEYGDYSAEEYEATISNSQLPSPKKATSESLDNSAELRTLGKRQENVASVLSEASEALLEEEAKLAKQLGVGTIDNLESILDAMEGIDEEGILQEPDTEDLAREARIRSAYLDWCKKYEKEPDDTRFETFSQNFLVMEDYSKESGKEMNLNKFADLTEDEYNKFISGEESTSMPQESTSIQRKGELVSEESSAQALREIDSQNEVSEADVRAEALKAEKTAIKAEVDAKANAAAEARRNAVKAQEAERAAAAAFKELSEKEQREISEKERKARQAAQAKAAEDLKMSNQAAVIEAERKRREEEANQKAKAQKLSEQASEIALQEAREAEVKLSRLTTKTKSKPEPEPEPQENFLSNLFSQVPKENTRKKEVKPRRFSKVSTKTATFKAVEKKPEPTGTKPASLFPFSFTNFEEKSKQKSMSNPKAKPAVSKTKTKPISKQSSSPASTGFSFFSPKPAPPPAPSSKPFSFFNQRPTAKPETKSRKENFSFFNTNTVTKQKTKTVRKPIKASRRSIGTKPIKKQVEKSTSSGFSFFGGNKADAANDGIPVISRFKQNDDGSLTGFVRNSKGFRNGTKITTSPVRKGAKAGQVVRTQSGSRYRLE